ncbi:MAG: ATP-dependent helicase, partial [Flavobacterium sp.]
LYIKELLKIDEGKATKKAFEAREKAEKLEVQRQALLDVSKFTYDDNVYSNYSQGELGHEEIINVSASLIQSRPLLRRLIGQKYPYILVDEAQDTQEEIVSSLNAICSNPGLPIIGYFGDPMQQIYDKRAGNFKGPEGSELIYKEENFRCSVEVIKLLNAFRKDFQQIPAGENRKIIGSVKIKCITAEKPSLSRNRYSEEQMNRVSDLLDETVSKWCWADQEDVKHLYLVRQMIARKLGFISLHEIFDGKYASQKTKNDFETGDYFLLKPFINCLYPLISAFKLNQNRLIIDILRQYAPAFHPSGINSRKSLSEMMKFASQCASELNAIWESGNIGEVLQYAVSQGLIKTTDRIDKQLSR